MQFISKITGVFKSHRGAVIGSLASAIVLFLICYFVDNSPYSFIGGASVGQRIERIRMLSGDNEIIPEDLLLINVAYDRQLVEVQDSFGLSKGNIDITDRSKLLRLLRELENSGYKYIVLDVALTDEYKSDSDSALFSQIASMDNIVIAKSENTRVADEMLKEKARYTDYATHILESNFVKYEFVKYGEPTLPYQVYLDLYSDSINCWGWFYTFNGNLANKSVVLRHPIKLWNKYSPDKNIELAGGMSYYNMGSDLLDIDVDAGVLAKDKLVVIGDFEENDMHDTYLGKIAGPIINLNAYYALVNDDLSIPWWEIVFLILFYAVISYFIFRRISVMATIPFLKKIKSGFARFLLSYVGISTLLLAVAVAMYLLFGLDMNVFIPSIYFTLLIPLRKYVFKY